MRRLACSILAPAILLGASAPAQPQAPPLEQALQQARSEQAAADVETARLERAAASARGEAARLAAEEAAAAQAIEAAEARITTADVQYRLADAFVAAQRRQLATEQQPVSALLSGLAIMARRPPLLAVMDEGGTDELVKVSVLLDSTLPIIRARTRALSAQLQRGQRLEKAALYARAELDRSRQALDAKRTQFARLQRSAIERSLAAGGQALGSSDTAIAASEQVERIGNAERAGASARQLALLLAAEPPAPARPVSSGGSPRAPFAYMLPVRAQLTAGLGEVNDSGVRSRGNDFATDRGAPLLAPADGIVRYSGPYRDSDGILVLDHGGGWISLIVNLSSPLRVGQKVHLGDTIGQALGPIRVQLSHDGTRFSPALIAGSSDSLSKGTKRG